MIKVTQEMLDGIHTDSDIYDLAEELGVDYGELDYAISNKYAEGTVCHNCKYLNMRCSMYPCNNCARIHKTDYYESI